MHRPSHTDLFSLRLMHYFCGGLFKLAATENSTEPLVWYHHSRTPIRHIMTS